jgi:hypothetical protein
MRSEPIKTTSEITEKMTYQIPKLETHGAYTSKVGGGGSFGNAPTFNEFWDGSKFWEDLERPSF